MVDYTKWDTGQVIANGVPDRPALESAQPAGLKLQRVDEDSESELRAGLETGGIEASMYYGCWSIWKAGQGFDGELMQYRNVTDRFTGLTLDGALEKAEEWVSTCGTN